MGKFILKRFVYAVISLVIIATVSFFLICMKPGDPIAAKVSQLPESSRKVLVVKYGLDQPMFTRFTEYMKGLITEGNLGDSIVYEGRNVNMMLKTSAVVSAKIGLMAIAIQVIAGVLLGMIQALYRGKLSDQVIRVLVVLAICIPSFVFCALLQYFIGFKGQLTPIMGWGKPVHYILPVAAYAIPGIATYCKYMRTSTIGVLGEDYILTATAKGCSQTRLVFKHIFRNAILPVVTMVPVAISNVFAGSMVIEKFLFCPGMGQHYVKAVSDSDPYMILGMAIFFACTYIISLFFVDILYGLVDPRIRVAKSAD